MYLENLLEAAKVNKNLESIVIYESGIIGNLWNQINQTFKISFK
jgi:hypothetical protein